jgi:hypothetical protein
LALLLVYGLLLVGTGAAMYAIARHGADAKAAFGVAAVCALGVLLSVAGMGADPRAGPVMIEVFFSPEKLLGAFAEELGFVPALLAMLGGAGLGLAAAELF